MLTTAEIGARLKQCRENMCLTREQFAEMINVTPRFVYDIELGNKGMSMSTMIRMGEASGISIDYVLFGKEQSKVSPEILALIESCPEERIEELRELIKSFLDNQ